MTRMVSTHGHRRSLAVIDFTRVEGTSIYDKYGSEATPNSRITK
jgi:hypothetical protein